MKAALVIFLCVYCYAECRKIVPPVDKSANVAFINMEGGGAGFEKPQPKTNAPTTPKPVVAAPVQPVTTKPLQPQPTLKPQQPALGPMKPQQAVTPKPAHQTPAAKPVSTPGPGSVKQLVTFYDSQGKASVIRPYSYSDAVKKNKN